MPLSPGLDNRRPLSGHAAALPRQSPARRIASALFSSAACKSLASVFDQAVVSGTSFATSVIIGRMCSREELGVYALALSVVRFVSGVQNELVCSPYLVNNIHRKGEALAAYLGSSLVHHFLLTSLSVLGLLGLAGLLALGIGPTALAPVIWALAGALPLLVLRDCVRQLSLCHLHLTAVLAIDISVAAIQLGGMWLLGYWQILSVSGAYAVAGAACGLACLGWLLAGGQSIRVVPAQLHADWKHNWSFSRWTLSGFLISTTTPYFMPWIVAFAHGEAVTGMLAACSTLANCASTFVTGLINVLSPRAVAAFARQGPEGLRLVLRNAALLFALSVGPFCLFIFASGDLSIRLLYGNKFAGCSLVLALLAMTVFANSMGITAGNGLWAVGRPRANFLADVCALVVTWAVLLCAVGPLGAVGAAVALFAGAVSAAAVRTATLLRTLAAQQARPEEECS